MDTESSIKAYLDSLAQVPGAVLVRNGLHWQGLAPGTAGDVLTLDDAGLPAWEAPNRYAPAMLQYSGATPHYRLNNFTTTNNSITFVQRFATDDATTVRQLATLFGTTTFLLNAFINTDGKLYVSGQNSAAAICYRVRSIDLMSNGTPKYLFFDYNRLTGAVVMRVNGQDQDDPAYASRIANPATLQATALGAFFVGANGVAGQYWQKQIGSFGFKQTTGLDWTDFMSPNGRPKPLNISGWPEWAGQPPVWHESGELDRNRGSAAAFTRNQTIQLANPAIWS